MYPYALDRVQSTWMVWTEAGGGRQICGHLQCIPVRHEEWLTELLVPPLPNARLHPAVVLYAASMPICEGPVQRASVSAWAEDSACYWRRLPVAYGVIAGAPDAEAARAATVR